MTIQLLSESTINRIAAGEVVDRPLSIVRELVDNALDASSETITVELENGGHSLIRIVDDGVGIPPDEIEIAFERHATSKIEDETDLESLSSYGFRGEALAAIASVSKVRIRSRVREEKAGTELSLDGGKIVRKQKLASVIGTEIEVRELFFNTPARRKFLKTERGEVTAISSWLRSNFLLHPNVQIRFIVDGKEKFIFPQRESSAARAREIFGDDVVDLNYTDAGITVSGTLSSPSKAKATPQALTIFVNDRCISDRAIGRAVREGFVGTLKPNQFPLGYIHIELPSNRVDVNVHPQKQEVRFAESSLIFRTVLRAVRSAVGGFSAMPVQKSSPSYRSISNGPSDTRIESSPFASSSPSNVPSRTEFSVQESNRESINGQRRMVLPVSKPSPNSVVATAGEGEVSELSRDIKTFVDDGVFQYRDLRYLGTVMSCFLLCEYNESLVIVDMHAAHERVQYNKILEKLSKRKIKGERLLVPLALELDEESVEGALERKALFKSAGFVFEGVDFQHIQILEKPAWIPLNRIKRVFQELANDDIPLERSLESQLENVAARLACHASIRSGDSISKEEVYALFEALDATDWKAACPHGRPVTTTFSRYELETRFGRT